MRFLVAFVVLGIGCTSRNPLFCGDGVCTDPDHPFCDIDGSIAGQKQTCIAVSCMPGDFKQCRGNDALVCGAGGNDFDEKTCQNGCDPTSGCVGCVDDSSCANPTPKCDTGTHECRACAADADCASGVCDTSGGTCIAEATVAYASPTGGDGAACTKSDPCSVAHALAIANLSVNTVKLAPGIYAVSGLVITDKELTILGYGATLQSSVNSTLDVEDHSNVRIVGLTLVSSSTSAAGLICRQNHPPNVPIVAIDNVTIESAFTAAGAADCSLTIARSHLHSTAAVEGGYVVAGRGDTKIDRSVLRGGDGVAVIGGTLEIKNSVVADTVGPSGALTSRNQILGQGSLHVTFSTIANTAIKCLASNTLCGNGGACIDNSIILRNGGGDTVTGDTCAVTYSVVFPQTTNLPGTGNKIGMNPVLRDPSNGDYHLQPTSPAIDAADPTATDTSDLDGIPRPQGVRNDIGALEFKP